MIQFDFFENAVETVNDVVNVSSIPQRSPFRYPGGKTWFVPYFRKWIKKHDPKNITLIEPFAGGAIISLTAAFENLAKKIVMVEYDEEVSAVWKEVFRGDIEGLAQKIVQFDVSIETINNELQNQNKSKLDEAFCTILKNRVFHGGIITKGAGLIKNGENGKGLTSRWYPATLKKRLYAIKEIRHKVEYIEGDAFDIIATHANNPSYIFFIDPPYTKAGKRLYTHYNINHNALFELSSKIKGSFLMTYDETDEIKNYANKYGFYTKTIPMKTTHHITKSELLISNHPLV